MEDAEADELRGHRHISGQADHQGAQQQFDPPAHVVVGKGAGGAGDGHEHRGKKHLQPVEQRVEQHLPGQQAVADQVEAKVVSHHQKDGEPPQHIEPVIAAAGGGIRH